MPSPTQSNQIQAQAGVAAQQLKVLGVIYADTDCSNEVYDYATLHYKQRPIAESMPELVTWIDGCVPVDGDGFSPSTYTEGRGYRLTNAGYEALTAHNPDRWPIDRRRFWTTPTDSTERLEKETA